MRLHRGVDIVVATPGRLLDLMSQGFVHLKALEIFVLDEADRMLDMGFIHDVKKVIAKLPPKRQTLFFSATMPPEIAKLANSILTDPIKVEVAPQSTTAETIDQHCSSWTARTRTSCCSTCWKATPSAKH
jgi:ATP-dependent RNA helicase RhlE